MTSVYCLCYGKDDPGFEYRLGQEIFLSPKCPDWHWHVTVSDKIKKLMDTY